MPTFFISFPSKDDNIEKIISNKKEGEAFVKEILMTLDRIDCENNSQIFFDKKNLHAFIEDYKALENLLEIRIGLYTLEDALLNFISQNSIKITQDSNQEYDYRFKIKCFDDVDGIFLSLNKLRILNRTDYRHCENHRNYNPSKSPLIGGIGGFDNAEKLLVSAIGDVKTKKYILINTDKMNQDFIIRFEDEGFRNQYHAFHIVRVVNNQYVEDVEKLYQLKQRVPRSYKLIKYRESRNEKSN
jgi:hypothetical protein